MRWCLFLLGLTLGNVALAHTLQESTTEIVWLPDSGELQVTHSIHLDDALPLMADLGSPSGELTVALQARLMLYLEQHFSLKLDDAQIPLEAVGVQILGDYLWLYQECADTPPPQRLSVHISVLQAYFEGQRHLVNLIIGDQVRSLNLNRDTPQGTF